MVALMLALLAVPVAPRCAPGDVPSYDLPVCYRNLTWDVDLSRFEDRIRLFETFAEMQLNIKRTDIEAWYRKVNLVVAFDGAVDRPNYDCTDGAAKITLRQWDDVDVFAHEFLHVAQHRALRGWCDYSDQVIPHAIPVGWFYQANAKGELLPTGAKYAHEGGLTLGIEMIEAGEVTAEDVWSNEPLPWP